MTKDTDCKNIGSKWWARFDHHPYKSQSLFQ